MTNRMMDELCKGCLAYERVDKLMPGYSNIRYGECLGYIAEDIGCPCIRCLIKGMCDVICAEFKNREWYINDLQNYALIEGRNHNE